MADGKALTKKLKEREKLAKSVRKRRKFGVKTLETVSEDRFWRQVLNTDSKDKKREPAQLPPHNYVHILPLRIQRKYCSFAPWNSATHRAYTSF